jgi:hypothetical protein
MAAISTMPPMTWRTHMVEVWTFSRGWVYAGWSGSWLLLRLDWREIPGGVHFAFGIGYAISVTLWFREFKRGN